MRSALEEAFDFQIKVVGLPTPVWEHRFHPPRKWRFDFAWPDQMIAVEIEGGVYQVGRHQRAAGFVADLEKYNRAVIDGWHLLRFAAPQITSGEAISALEELFNVVTRKKEYV